MIILAAALLLAGNMAESAPALPEQAGFETELKFSAGGDVYRAIESAYPVEYRVLIDQIYRDAAANRNNDAGRAAIEKRLLAAFFRKHAATAAVAPEPLLRAINARQLALIQHLARDDPKLCADFAANLFVGRSDLPPSYQAEAAALLAAIVEAAKAGESAPPDPRRQSFTDEDSGPFYEQLLLVGPPGQIQAALAARPGEPGGTPEMQCRIGVAIYASIERLQPDQAANATAFFLTQTLAGSD